MSILTNDLVNQRILFAGSLKMHISILNIPEKKKPIEGCFQQLINITQAAFLKDTNQRNNDCIDTEDNR